MMKQTFTKYIGRVTEKLELELEDNWIYAHYTKGSVEKTTCILKNEEKSQIEYLSSFFKENNVSESMKKEVEKYFMNLKDSTASAHWKEFTNFLLKTLSLHTALGIAIAIAVYAGYLLGTKLDARLNVFPLFTLVGIFMGITVGVLTGYIMVKKYSKSPADNLNKVDTPNSKSIRNDVMEYPRIEITIDQVRKAVREFSDNLPKGAYRTILVQEDNRIDFRQLAPILGGIPTKDFYMSKETYDIFEEKDKIIPVEMDIVQRAVDQYVKEHKEYPMLKFDPHRRVNYYQLNSEHYLKSPPKTQFYISNFDGMITHIKPGKKTKKSSPQE
jgi:F0F1-type ATP synthase assembly protein I